MPAGRVLQLGCFPVKSLQGESPDSVRVGPGGVVGDRTHGLIDVETGKVASAKHPHRWAGLLELRAVRSADGALVVTLPDGASLRADDPDVDEHLSRAVGRSVHLSDRLPDDAGYDYAWEVAGIAPDEVVEGSRTGTTDDGDPLSTMPMAVMAPGTFQDVAPVTLLTTAALAAMAGHYPDGDWDPTRFRSNLLVQADGPGIVENDWLGRRLRVGGVLLEVTAPSPRCVMTTLPQLGLPRDRGILRTVAAHNMLEFAGLGRWACLGVYASVLEPGTVTVGDAVELV